MPPQRPNARRNPLIPQERVLETTEALGLGPERQQQSLEIIRALLASPGITPEERETLEAMWYRIEADPTDPDITTLIELDKAPLPPIQPDRGPGSPADLRNQRLLEEQRAQREALERQYSRMYGQPMRTAGFLGQWGDPAQHPIAAPFLNAALQPIPWLQRRATDIADLVDDRPEGVTRPATPESVELYKGRPVDREGRLGFDSPDKDMLGRLIHTILNPTETAARAWEDISGAGGRSHLPPTGPRSLQTVGAEHPELLPGRSGWESVAQGVEAVGDLPSLLDAIFFGKALKPVGGRLLRGIEDVGARAAARGTKDLQEKLAAQRRSAPTPDPPGVPLEDPPLWTTEEIPDKVPPSKPKPKPKPKKTAPDPAAEAGDAEAQFDLGNKYYAGEGVPEDKAEAVRWWRLAADQGDADAQYNVGVMYDTGQGVPRDEAEAVRWYRLAADQGHTSAQFNLGNMPEGAAAPDPAAAAVDEIPIDDTRQVETDAAAEQRATGQQLKDDPTAFIEAQQRESRQRRRRKPSPGKPQETARAQKQKQFINTHRTNLLTGLENTGLTSQEAAQLLDKAAAGDAAALKQLSPGGTYREVVERVAAGTPPSPQARVDLGDETPDDVAKGAAGQTGDAGQTIIDRDWERRAPEPVRTNQPLDPSTVEVGAVRRARPSSGRGAYSDEPRPDVAPPIERDLFEGLFDEPADLSVGAPPPVAAAPPSAQATVTDPPLGEDDLNLQRGAATPPLDPDAAKRQREQAQRQVAEEKERAEAIKNAEVVNGPLLKPEEPVSGYRKHAGGVPQAGRIIDAPATTAPQVTDKWREALGKVFGDGEEFDETVKMIETVAHRMRDGNFGEGLKEVQQYYDRILKSLRAEGPTKQRGRRREVEERTAGQVASQWTAGGGASGKQGARTLIGSMQADAAGVQIAEREALQRLMDAVERVRLEPTSTIPGRAVSAGRRPAAYSRADAARIVGEFSAKKPGPSGAPGTGVPKHPAYAQFVHMTWMRNKALEARAMLDTAYPTTSALQRGQELDTMMESLETLYQVSINELQSFANAVASVQAPGTWKQTSTKGRAATRTLPEGRGEGSRGLFGDAFEEPPNMEYVLHRPPATHGPEEGLFQGTAVVDPEVFIPRALNQRMNQYFDEATKITESIKNQSGFMVTELALTMLGGLGGAAAGVERARKEGKKGPAQLAGALGGMVVGGAAGASVIPFQRGIWRAGMSTPQKVDAFLLNSVLQRPRTLLKMLSGAYQGANAAGIELATEGLLDKWVFGNVARGEEIMQRGHGILGGVTRESARSLQGDPRSMFWRNLSIEPSTPEGQRTIAEITNRLQAYTGGEQLKLLADETTGKLGTLTDSLVGRTARAGDWTATELMVAQGVPYEAARNYALTGKLRLETSNALYDLLAPQWKSQKGGAFPGGSTTQQWLNLAKRPFSMVPKIGLMTGEMGIERAVAPFAQILDPALQRLFPPGSRLSALGAPGRGLRQAGMFSLDPDGQMNKAQLLTRLLGTGAAGGMGAAAGDHMDPKLLPLVTPLMGPWGGPFAIAAAANAARTAGRDVVPAVGKSMLETATPLPGSGGMPWEDPLETVTAFIPGILQDQARMLARSPEGHNYSGIPEALSRMPDADFADSPIGQIMQQIPGWTQGPVAKGIASVPGIGPWLSSDLPQKPFYNRNIFGQEAFPMEDVRPWTPGRGGWQALQIPTPEAQAASQAEMGRGLRGQPPQTSFWPSLGNELKRSLVRGLVPANERMRPAPPQGVDEVLRTAADWRLEGEPRGPVPGVPSAVWGTGTPSAPAVRRRGPDADRAGLPMQGVTRRGLELIAENITGQTNLDKYLWLQEQMRAGRPNVFSQASPLERRRLFLDQAKGIGSTFPAWQAAQYWQRR